jgi:hypothetical protein
MAAEGRLDTAVKIGALVSSLSGFAALATVTGGALTWMRFHAAHIPADDALAAIPGQDLVTIGVEALSTFALASIVAVLVAYLLDPKGTPGPRNQVAVATLATAACVIAVLLSRPSEPWRVAAGVAVPVFFGVGTLLLARAAWSTAASGDPSDRGRAVRLATFACACPTVVLALLLWLLSGHRWVAVMTLVSALLAGFGLHIAHRSGTRFRWYGVAIFLAIVVYGSVMSALRTYAEVKLQPAAVLRTADAGGGGLAGYYVAATADTVVLAYVDRCRRDGSLRLVPTAHSDRGRLVELPRTDVRALSIGRRVALDKAQEQGPILMGELDARLATGRAAPPPTSACAGEGIPDLSVRPTTPVTPEQARTLARRFRPKLRFDTAESWRPLNIDVLIGERTADKRPRQRICDLDGEQPARFTGPCVGLEHVEDLSDTTLPERLIDLAGSKLGGGDYQSPALDACPEPQKQGLLDCDSGPSSAIYYNVTRANDRYYVDYWWFLRYNRFDKPELDTVCASQIKRKVIGCFDHEGDWEGVTAVTTRDGSGLASVGLAAHSGVFRFPASSLDFDATAPDRPLIYVASGSHASYPHPCPSRCRQFSRVLGVQLPETDTNGKVPWGADDDDAALAPLPAVWRNFNGRWGSPVCSVAKGTCQFEAGPKSPARQERYQRPWCYTGDDGRLKCDGAPPTVADPTAKVG